MLAEHSDTRDLTSVCTQITITPPPLYRVILLNDDFTPREFVVIVLQKFFQMDDATASKVMMTAHKQGACACGVFTKDIAETKVSAIHEFAKQFQLPLRFETEKA